MHFNFYFTLPNMFSIGENSGVVDGMNLTLI